MADSALLSLRDLIHELKDPFAAVHGGLELIALEGLSPEEREHLGSSLQRNAAIMRGLLEDAGVYLGLLTQPFPAKSEGTDLPTLLAGAVEDTRNLLSSRGQEIKTEAEEGDFRTDERAVRRAVASLLGALSRVSNRGAVLELRARLSENELSVEVRGSSQDLILKQNDFRLALAERLAQWLSGRLERVEQAGLILRVPISFGSALRSAPTETATDRGCVLVADGSRDGADMLALGLEARGFQVEVCYRGAEASRLISEGKVSAAVLDLALPGDACSVASTAREQGFRGILVAIGEPGEEALPAFDTMLAKPIDLATLGGLLEAQSHSPIRRVAVIEDNPLARRAMLDLLKGLDVEAWGAGTAEEGLELVERERPDLVLCDLGLPGVMDGLDVARSLRSKGEAILIAVTGDSESRKEEALGAGFHEVMGKPVGRRELQLLLARPRPFPTSGHD